MKPNIKTSFIIYCRAVGLYALLSLPLITIPEAYFTSLKYVLVYGWFAWAVFTVLSLVIDKLVFDFAYKIFLLFVAAVAAVAVAYEMIELLTWRDYLWRSYFIIFPFGGLIAAWISICISRETIRNSSMQEQII